MPVHERLARYIAAKGWSQRQAGEALGCSQAMVSDLIAGRRKPGLTTAHAIERQTADWPGADAEPAIRTEEWDDSLASEVGADG